MKTIKKYWALIIGGIIALFGLTAFLAKRRNAKQADKIDAAIDQNASQVDINAGKIEVIEDIKDDVKQEVVAIEQQITETKQKKQSITPKKPKSAKAAKENILSKTNKKKPAKKKTL
jgi:hypothetical protein